MTEEDFKQWKQSDVTKAFFKALEKEREFMKENLVNDVYENPEQVKGRCHAIVNILGMDFQGLVEALNL